MNWRCVVFKKKARFFVTNRDEIMSCRCQYFTSSRLVTNTASGENFRFLDAFYISLGMTLRAKPSGKRQPVALEYAQQAAAGRTRIRRASSMQQQQAVQQAVCSSSEQCSIKQQQHKQHYSYLQPAPAPPNSYCIQFRSGSTSTPQSILLCIAQGKQQQAQLAALALRLILLLLFAVANYVR